MSEELILAIFNNQIGKVKELLLSDEIDINFRYQTKAPTFDKIFTPLQVASMQGSIEIVEILLADKRIEPLAKSGAGRTALHIAAACGFSEICKSLLPVSNPIAIDQRRLTPFGNAIVSLSNTKDPSYKSRLEKVLATLAVPTFVVASENNAVVIAKKMVEEYYVDINGLYEDQSALHAACKTLSNLTFAYLLSLKKINVNLQNSKGWTPLHYLLLPFDGKTLTVPYCQKGDDQALRIAAANQLINAGANPNIITFDYAHETPLYLAISYNQLDFVKFLILSGASLNITRTIPAEIKNKYLSDIPEDDMPVDVLSSAVNRPIIFTFLKDYIEGRYRFNKIEIIGDTMVTNKIAIELYAHQDTNLVESTLVVPG